LKQLFRFYTETESFDVWIEPKQSEDPPKKFKRKYIWVFFRKFRVVSVCFGLLRNSSVCFGCFDIGSKHRNKPKFFIFGFMKETETNAKQILFLFVSVRTKIYFCLFRGHPSSSPPTLPAGRCLSFSVSCVSPIDLTDGRGGDWGAAESFIRRRESLVLYKSFSTL
jgi:hypothetical protein